jgi:hypothetical protein
MRARNGGAAAMPLELLRWSPEQDPEEWWVARRVWLAEHRPASLDDLSARFVATTFPPRPDPRSP